MTVVQQDIVNNNGIIIRAKFDYTNSGNTSVGRVFFYLIADASGTALSGSYVKFGSNTINIAGQSFSSTSVAQTYTLYQTPEGSTVTFTHDEYGDYSLNVSVYFSWNGYMYNSSFQRVNFDSLSGSGTLGLEETVVRPDRPSMYCDNIKSKTSDAYVCDNTINIRLTPVTDPMGGGIIYYRYFGQYQEPGSSTLQSMGDSNNLVKKTTDASYKYAISKYKPGTHFVLQINAGNKAGYESARNTLNTAYKNKYPATPTNIIPATSSYLNDGTLTVSWNASSDPEGYDVNYYVYQSIDDADFILKEKTSAAKTSFDMSKLSGGSKVRFKIYAYDNFGADVAVTTPYYYKNSPPTAPTNIQPNGGEYTGPLRITWGASTDPENRFKEYELIVENDRYSDKYDAFTKNNYWDFSVNSTHEPGTVYSITVIAYDQDGGKAQTTLKNAYKKGTPQLEGAPIITYPTNNNFTKDFTLRWTYDVSGASYTIDIYENEIKVNTVTTTEKSYYYNGSHLNSNDTVQFKIQAIMGYAKSDWCNSPIYTKANDPASAPVLVYPIDNGNVYDKCARMLFHLPAESEGSRTFYVSVNGSVYNTDDNSSSFASTPSLKESNILFKCAPLTTGNNVITIYTKNSGVQSVVKTYNINLIDVPDSKVTKNTSYITATCFNNMLSVANTIRKSYGMTQLNYANSIVANETLISSDYLNTIYKAINDVTMMLNNYSNNKTVFNYSIIGGHSSGDSITAATVNDFYNKIINV